MNKSLKKRTGMARLTESEAITALIYSIIITSILFGAIVLIGKSIKSGNLDYKETKMFKSETLQLSPSLCKLKLKNSSKCLLLQGGGVHDLAKKEGIDIILEFERRLEVNPT